MRARISSSGHLVLPTEIRRKLGIRAGSVVEIEEVPGGVLLRPIRDPVAVSLDDLLGCTGYTGPRRTLRDMERGCTSRTTGRHPLDASTPARTYHDITPPR